MINVLESDMTPDPFDMFSTWFKEAKDCKTIGEANAMNLATVDANNRPSSRMVLLKGYDENGFVFYTNLKSRKGNDLSRNRAAALCFYWEPLGKQVRIEGLTSYVTDKEADSYFSTRPFKSRIGAWASQQSRPLASQKQMIKDIAHQTARFATKPVTRPDHWSGFRLTPDYFEFWSRGAFRIHERTCHKLDQNGRWQTQLLYP